MKESPTLIVVKHLRNIWEYKSVSWFLTKYEKKAFTWDVFKEIAKIWYSDEYSKSLFSTILNSCLLTHKKGEEFFSNDKLMHTWLCKTYWFYLPLTNFENIYLYLLELSKHKKDYDLFVENFWSLLVIMKVILDEFKNIQEENTNPLIVTFLDCFKEFDILYEVFLQKYWSQEKEIYEFVKKIVHSLKISWIQSLLRSIYEILIKKEYTRFFDMYQKKNSEHETFDSFKAKLSDTSEKNIVFSQDNKSFIEDLVMRFNLTSLENIIELTKFLQIEEHKKLFFDFYLKVFQHYYQVSWYDYLFRVMLKIISIQHLNHIVFNFDVLQNKEIMYNFFNTILPIYFEIFETIFNTTIETSFFKDVFWENMTIDKYIEKHKKHFNYWLFFKQFYDFDFPKTLNYEKIEQFITLDEKKLFEQWTHIFKDQTLEKYFYNKRKANENDKFKHSDYLDFNMNFYQQFLLTSWLLKTYILQFDYFVFFLDALDKYTFKNSNLKKEDILKIFLCKFNVMYDNRSNTTNVFSNDNLKILKYKLYSFYSFFKKMKNIDYISDHDKKELEENYLLLFETYDNFYNRILEQAKKIEV